MSLPNPLRIIQGGVGEDEVPAGSGDAAVPDTLPVPVAPTGAPDVRGWLSAAVQNRHLGGGPDGLAAHLANPRPEPLITHLRHAGIAIRDARDPENSARGMAAATAAYYILFAIPVKLLAKTVRHGADIFDWAADRPILASLIVILALFLFLLS